jgi:signal peptidase I
MDEVRGEGKVAPTALDPAPGFGGKLSQAGSAQEKENKGAGTGGTGGSKAKEDDSEHHVSALREWFGLIARAAFWAMVLYLFVFQVSVVEGPSMQPNFQTNDRLVIDKVTYRLSSVHRFDVIVFQAMDMDRRLPDREYKDYIKRVIGLPGEEVELKGGRILINGKLIEEPFGPKPEPHYFSGNEKFLVPPRHYFVLGDNRGDSKDSRNPGIGYVPEGQIRGLARLRFLPVSRWTWFSRFE